MTGFSRLQHIRHYTRDTLFALQRPLPVRNTPKHTGSHPSLSRAGAKCARTEQPVACICEARRHATAPGAGLRARAQAPVAVFKLSAAGACKPVVVALHFTGALTPLQHYSALSPAGTSEINRARFKAARMLSLLCQDIDLHAWLVCVRVCVWKCLVSGCQCEHSNLVRGGCAELRQGALEMPHGSGGRSSGPACGYEQRRTFAGLPGACAHACTSSS